MLAFAMTYLSRMRDSSPNSSTTQQITTYMNSASKLCASALPATTQRVKEGVLDTTVILFNLDVSNWQGKSCFLVS